MIKTYLTIVIAVVCFGAGMGLQYKLTREPVIKIPPCPDCNCPPNVSVQQLDMNAIRKVKGDFVYSPEYSGTIIMNNCNDTIKTK